MRKASERSATLVRAQIPLIETMLADGREFILGQATTIADFAIYHALWFITARTRRLEPELTAYPCILRWMERMRGFGHGRSTAMFPEEALDVAAETSPEPVRTSLPFAEDPRLGDNVRIRADDYGKDIVEGELVLINVDEIALRRQDARVGEIVVHFPRLGYDLRRI